MLPTEKIADVVKEYQRKPGDCGSSEVQIALLTTRINTLQEHFKKFKKDNHSRRGLMQMVAARRSLLSYLKRKNIELYRSLLTRLGIRG